MRLIDENRERIVALCQKHNVRRLLVFGSILTDRFNAGSDVDLLVSFNKEEVGDYFNNFFNLKYALEALFGREVDLLEEEAIRNPYLQKSVNATKALIYG